MSDLEKARRSYHNKWRNRMIRIQTIIICVLAVSTVLSLFASGTIKKNTYVPYTEEGNVIHRAYLADNKFFEENYLNGSHAYIASLIDEMTADFSYNLEMALDDVQFQYTYRIDAQIEIKDKASNSPIFNPIENIIPATSKKVTGKSLAINELVSLDYNEYNRIAQEFVNSYNVENTVNTLIARMHVSVVGASESFAEDNTGEYVIELHIPLLETTVKPSVSTTIPAGVQMIVAKDTKAQGTFVHLAIASGVLTLIAAGVLGLFILLSRNKHVDYARKVQMLVSNYKPYIQKILDEYDTTDYQVIRVEEFTELLEIRDTIHQPIFMYENADKTSAKFFVVTNLNTVCVYEIKVEGEEDSRDYKEAAMAE